jgi:lipid II:glycine glycyltransferase (peptidoglycan interpeptide bridge formation enzyme)
MIEIKEATIPESFQPTTLSPEAPFTQAWFYGEWQQKLNRPVKRLLIYRDQKLVGAAQFVKYPLIAGQSYWYAPFGPVLNQHPDPEIILAFKKYFAVGESQPVFVRFDFTPALAATDWNTPTLSKAPHATYHGAYFQPRHEWILDLAPSSETLLKNMAKNCRYEIKLAERKGITIEITEDLDANFEIFYKLMSTTANRNGFHLHPRHYYEHIFKTPTPDGQLFLVIARHEQAVLAINLILGYGREAYYLFAASGNEQRELKPAYLAQWASINEAKRRGFSRYNFGGISAGDSDPSWAGLTAFKKKFGGTMISHSTFYDLVYRRLWYYIYCLRKQLKQRS